MKLKFKEQEFQLRAVDAVVQVFKGQKEGFEHFSFQLTQELLHQARAASIGQTTIDYGEVEETIGYRNREINISANQLLENIREIQKQNDISPDQKLVLRKAESAACNLTVEMETGTGKTYTYIRTMYELKRHYGWNKFIIVVPSVAIREGVYQAFGLTSEHFQKDYKQKIRPFIYKSAKPDDIEDYITSNGISVMIINTQAFNVRGKDARRIYMELDDFGTRRPIQMIANTRPILIIDEPQSVDGKQTLEALKEFNPLFTIRYSATHKEPYNMVYRLDALDAYNQKLVKKIQVKGINLKGSTGTTGYIYLERIDISPDKAPAAIVEFEVRQGSTVNRIRRRLETGADLFELSGQMPQYLNYSVTDIDAYYNKITLNGQDVYIGEALGNVDDTSFCRIQIRETIQSHLEKERYLYGKGIKVLTLFFIDAVEKYKQYDQEGKEVAGEYARIFEEEYNLVRNEFLDLFNQEYNEYLQKHPTAEVYKGYADSRYFDYLQRDDASQIHSGYFSIDRKSRRLTNGHLKRGREESDDENAYELIMRDKERLLSFEEPVRFIFSHSALKEGWDNPNVFQICALKHSDAEVRRRQEVGRGMRLCVNKEGIRQDYESVGEEVQQINRLTVIASESYEIFAKGLQAEIAATLRKRPQRADIQFFLNQWLCNEKGQKKQLDLTKAQEICMKLAIQGIVDEKGNFTENGKSLVANGNIHFPDDLQEFRTDLLQRLQKLLLTGQIPHIDNEKTKISLQLNDNFYQKEFQELWKLINHKTTYKVNFDSSVLIQKSIESITTKLFVSERYYEIKKGELKEAGYNEILQGEAFENEKKFSQKDKSLLNIQTPYDVIGEISRNTALTRKTIVNILKGITSDKFSLFSRNPEEFIMRCCHFINEVKASLLIDNISYYKTEKYFDTFSIFQYNRSIWVNTQPLKKHIYSYLLSDSQTEKNLVEELEKREEVLVYAKLPKSFYISTPIGKYSPDWAIVMDKEKVKNAYLLVETKGSLSELELRDSEKLKIQCARKHFEVISGGKVKYEPIANYDDLLRIAEIK